MGNLFSAFLENVSVRLDKKCSAVSPSYKHKKAKRTEYLVTAGNLLRRASDIESRIGAMQSARCPMSHGAERDVETKINSALCDTSKARIDIFVVRNSFYA